MANLFWTIAPFVVTFAVAAWHSPSAKDKQQSTAATCCDDAG